MVNKVPRSAGRIPLRQLRPTTSPTNCRASIVGITEWPGSEGAGRLTRWLKSHTAATASAGCHSACLCGSTFVSRLSYRDVEGLLAERGLDISYETIRSWVLKFGRVIARRLRRRPPRPSDRNGGPDRRRAVVPLARRRPRRSDPRHAGSAPAQLGDAPTNCC